MATSPAHSSPLAPGLDPEPELIQKLRDAAGRLDRQWELDAHLDVRLDAPWQEACQTQKQRQNRQRQLVEGRAKVRGKILQSTFDNLDSTLPYRKTTQVNQAKAHFRQTELEMLKKNHFQNSQEERKLVRNCEELKSELEQAEFQLEESKKKEQALRQALVKEGELCAGISREQELLEERGSQALMIGGNLQHELEKCAGTLGSLRERLVKFQQEVRHLESLVRQKQSEQNAQPDSNLAQLGQLRSKLAAADQQDQTLSQTLAQLHLEEMAVLSANRDVITQIGRHLAEDWTRFGRRNFAEKDTLTEEFGVNLAEAFAKSLIRELIDTVVRHRI